MNLVAVELVLVSAFLHAFRDFLTKQGSDKQLFIWWYRLVGLVIYFPFLVYFWEGTIPVGGWICIVASALVHIFYWYTLGEAYQEGDLSLVYPIARSAPIFVLLWAGFVWQEAMTTGGVTGVLIVVFGAYILQMKGVSWQQVLAPILATAHHRAIRMAWLTALFVAAYSLIDDRGVELVHPFVYLYIFQAIGFVAYIPYLMRTRRGRIVAEWRAHRYRIGLAGMIAMAGYLLALYALQIERVGYVTAVRQLSIVFGVVLGSLLLGEPHRRIRLMASLVMFLGTVLIVVFG